MTSFLVYLDVRFVPVLGACLTTLRIEDIPRETPAPRLTYPESSLRSLASNCLPYFIIML